MIIKKKTAEFTLRILNLSLKININVDIIYMCRHRFINILNKYILPYFIIIIIFFIFCSHRVEQMDGGFFERYGSGLKENFEEDTIIAEKDKFATLNEREISEVYKDTADRTQLSYTELLSSLLELNVSLYTGV